ncbi:hypothetical protein MMC30_008758 [Trapelia coarctata]|nr:hypothetical protein [Trapelia coarctata]
MTGDPKRTLSLLEELSSLSKSLDTSNGFKDDATRTQFVQAAEKLAIAARRPDENIFFLITRITQASAIRSALGLDVFSIVPSEEGKTISASEIASTAGASKLVVVRIMRALIACHIFDEAGEEKYAHNELSRGFILLESRNMFKEIYDLISKGAYALPEFLAKTGWQNPEDYNNSAFHLGQHTDLGFWEFLESNEEHMKNFNVGMRSQATVQEFENPYPFDKELNKGPVGEDEVVLVDVGGGRGHALERIKERYPGLKGRLILQDLEMTIKDAVAGGLAPGTEAQAANFFEPNPAKHARAYFFRRVLHDWSDGVCRTILSNTVSAMGPESRVLIAEYEVPAVGAPAKLVLQDLNMMAISGMERTEKQWAELLDQVGLKMVKIWRNQTGNFVVVEGRLKNA